MHTKISVRNPDTNEVREFTILEENLQAKITLAESRNLILTVAEEHLPEDIWDGFED